MNVREGLLRARIDPRLNGETLSQIACRAVGRTVRARSWRVLTGGCWNRVLAVALEPGGEEIVLKISPEPGDRGIEREFRILQYFVRSTSMAVPHPLLVDASGSLVPGTVLAMSRVPGRVMHGIFGRLDGDQRRAVSTQIAEAVAELHQATASGFGGVELPEAERSSWPQYWLPRLDGVLEEVRASGLVAPSFLDGVERLRGELPRLLAIGSQAVLTHYDVWSGNVMIALDGGRARVSGFLDVQGIWADGAREISFAEMFGVADRRFAEVYFSIHRPDAGWPVRAALYNLKMHLKHITMYPDDAGYREGARRCLAAVRSAL